MASGPGRKRGRPGHKAAARSPGGLRRSWRKGYHRPGRGVGGPRISDGTWEKGGVPHRQQCKVTGRRKW